MSKIGLSRENSSWVSHRSVLLSLQTAQEQKQVYTGAESSMDFTLHRQTSILNGSYHVGERKELWRSVSQISSILCINSRQLHLYSFQITRSISNVKVFKKSSQGLLFPWYQSASTLTNLSTNLEQKYISDIYMSLRLTNRTKITLRSNQFSEPINQILLGNGEWGKGFRTQFFFNYTQLVYTIRWR